MADELPGSVAKPLVWIGTDDLPLHFVNQFLGVVQPNEVFLLLGSLVPPAITGDTAEERKAQAEAVPFVPVKPIVRLGMTPARLKELIGVLQETLVNFEGQPKAQS